MKFLNYWIYGVNPIWREDRGISISIQQATETYNLIKSKFEVFFESNVYECDGTTSAYYLKKKDFSIMIRGNPQTFQSINRDIISVSELDNGGLEKIVKNIKLPFDINKVRNYE